MNAGLWHSKHCLPQFSQRFFNLIPWRDPGRRSTRCLLRNRKRASIDLSCRTKRHHFHPQNDGGHHIVRQSGCEITPNLVEHRFQRWLAGDIPYQPLLLRLILSKQDCSLIHAGKVTQHIFHFTQFDPEPTQLDLLIHPSKKLNIAVLPISSQVAGPIQPGTCHMGVREKPFLGQLRLIHISTSQAIPRHIQLTRYADGRRLQACIQHIQLHTIDRFPDRHSRSCFLACRLIHATPNRGFCRPIFVVQRGGRHELVMPSHEFKRKALSGGNDDTK